MRASKLLLDGGRRMHGFLAADLVVFHDPVSAPRPWWWRAGSFVAVAASLGVLAVVDPLGPPEYLTHDKHRNRSLEIALNRVLCGTRSRLSTSIGIAEHLEAHPELHDTALRDVTSSLVGSVHEYCETVTRPFLNNENSLMLEMAFFMAVEPRLSFDGLGWRLQATRILALLVFAFVLLENGASLLFAGTMLSLGLGIVGYLDATYFSIYPFLHVLLALVIAGLSFSVQRGLPRGSLGHAVAAGMAGGLVAFAANMRTSHLPVHLALLMLYLLAAYRLVHRERQPWPFQRQAGWVTAGVLSIGICYGLFGLLFIQPLSREGSMGRIHSHHPVAHPLVLALAVPESPLSRREGIAWNDGVGLELARRVDPEVSYLKEGYESALFTYYRGLWTHHPREMSAIYLAKLRMAGRDMISELTASPLRAVILPFRWVPNGIVLLLLYAGAFSVSLAVHLRRGSPFALTVALVAAASILLHLEFALIVPEFAMTHHGSQLLCFLFFCVLAWQLSLEGARLVVQSARRRRREDEKPSA